MCRQLRLAQPVGIALRARQIPDVDQAGEHTHFNLAAATCDLHPADHRQPRAPRSELRGPPPEQAFTFSLVNIHTDPDETGRELDALADVFRAVRDDGRGEDDVILLGDLNVDDHHLGRLGELPHVHWAISGVATNTRGDKLYDNILFSEMATSEYTGRWGVFDLIREFNLTIDEALKVSDHMPVWAEFNLYEGGQGGRIATRPFNPTR